MRPDGYASTTWANSGAYRPPIAKPAVKTSELPLYWSLRSSIASATSSNSHPTLLDGRRQIAILLPRYWRALVSYSAMRLTGRLGALEERQFRLLWAGQAVSAFGDGLYPVALAFAVVRLTGSVADLGLVFTAVLIPRVVLLL